jgi:5-methylcytosine-specific restriction endonuclease McrA
MVIKGKAEELECDGLMWRSPSYTFRLPSVIRLRYYIKRPYMVGVTFSKKNVFKRDRFVCQYCGSRGQEMTIDHVIPKSRGGETCWENVVVACKECNVRKGDRALHEARMSLIRKPKRPSFLFYLNLAQFSNQNFKESWNKYLPVDFRIQDAGKEASMSAT